MRAVQPVQQALSPPALRPEWQLHPGVPEPRPSQPQPGRNQAEEK